jgi:hypothetical protein
MRCLPSVFRVVTVREQGAPSGVLREGVVPFAALRGLPLCPKGRCAAFAIRERGGAVTPIPAFPQIKVRI